MKKVSDDGKRYYLGVRQFIQGVAIHYLHHDAGPNRSLYAWLGATDSEEEAIAFMEGARIEGLFEETSYKKIIFKKVSSATMAMSIPLEEKYQVFVSKKLMRKIETDKTNEWNLLNIFSPFNQIE